MRRNAIKSPHLMHTEKDSFSKTEKEEAESEKAVQLTEILRVSNSTKDVHHCTL